jgi:hypothetical protein
VSPVGGGRGRPAWAESCLVSFVVYFQLSCIDVPGQLIFLVCVAVLLS